jgi:ATP-dependent Lon protease
MSETELAGTLRLPVIFLRNTIVFPGVTRPIKVGRPKSLAVAKLAGRERKLRLALVTQIVAEVEDPGIADLFPIGVEAESLERKKISATRATLLTLGIRRIRLLSLEESEGILWGNFEEVPETVQDEVEAQGLAMAVRCSAKELLSHSPDAPTEATFILDQIRNPGQLADMVAANLESSIPEEMELLNILDVPKRLREVLKRLHHALETQKVKEHIGCRVKSAMDKHQREFVLQQQIRAIQGELGETDEDDEVAEFAERIAKAGMPDEVEEVARKQLTRLQRIPIQSPEHTVNRTYLEWLLDLPWSRTTEDHLDLKRARRILNEDHYGLDNVTKRIIEYLAVRSLKPDKKGPILCLVGPPGVGKTSTGRSVARALGREFVRASLGGMCDEAEIRGHRRTYVGALPGRILQGIKRAGTRNPVFVLDEIDKLGSDFWGDPSSALLEVLDPDQNHSFSDHYLQFT